MATAVIDIRVKGGSELSRVRKQVKDINNLVRGIRPVPALFDKRTFQGLDALFGKNRRVLDAANKLSDELEGIAKAEIKIKGTTASLNRQLGNLQGVFDNLSRGGKEWKNTLVSIERAQVAVAQAEQQAMVQRQKALSNASQARGRDIVGKTLALSIDKEDIANSIDGLTAYRSELLRLFTSVEIGSKHYLQLEEAIKKVDKRLEKPKLTNVKTPDITRGIGGLAGREQALKEALRIQNQLETGSDAHIKSIVGVRKAQQAYNQELRVSKTIQSALNLDLIVWKKLLDSVPAIMGKIAGGMKGLFMGKFGKLGQAAGVIGVSSAIEQLIQKIPFLDQGLKNNIQRWASWTQRAVEGITGVTIAWTALSGLLGGAQWVAGAIAGFVQFEAAASKVVWSIEGNITRAFSAFGRLSRELPQLAQAIAMTMPQALGGLGVSGSWQDYMAEGSQAGKIADALGGGKGRKEARRYTRQGPTELQNAQKDLNQINKMLEQRNVTSKGYADLLRRQIQAKIKIKELQKGINQFVDKTLQDEIAAGNVYAKDAYPQEYLEHINKSKEALKELNKLETQNRDQQRQDADKLIKDRGQARFDEVKKRWQLEATGHKNEMKRIKERQAAERQRIAARKKAWSRFGENVMLGAGFPMLFGGGPGAVAGGLTGAVGQSLMGSSGFGMQILFSAVGQQVDAFVGKAAELGKAFNKINPDVDAVIGSLGEVNTEYGKHLEMLKKIKGDAAAMVEATRRLTEIIGEGGVAAMEKLGDDTTRLGNEWKKMTTLMMASISELINSSGILLTLTQLISKANRFNIFERRVKDITAGGKSFGDLSQNEKDIMDLAGLRKGILENQGGDKFKQWIRENVAGLTQVLPDGMGGKSMTDFLSRSSGQREALANIDNQIDTLMRKVLAEESIGNLLGSGADKAALLQEEIKHLERSLEIGTKKAGIEREVAEYYKAQGKNVDEILPKEKALVQKRIEARETLKEQLELWEQIKDTIATGLTSAIQGLIDGTKSLGESLASIAKSIGSMLLQSAISGWLAPMGMPRFAEGGYMVNGIKPFASGGLATRPTLGLVGEAGEDEYIIPASKMAASMQRYSAGARGEDVIPGTGSSHVGAGGGASTTINYSGPILNFNSEEFVPKAAVGQIIATATSQGAKAGENRTLSTLRNSRSTRSRLGM